MCTSRSRLEYVGHQKFLWAIITLVGVLCVTKGSVGKLIVNGRLATPNLFPFAVSLQVYSPGKESRVHKCTLSLLNVRTCLGAAHCIYDINPETKTIVRIPEARMCGITGSILQDEKIACTEFISYFPHDRYKPTEGNFDIATFILLFAVTFGEGVRPIKLAAPTFKVPLRTEVRLAGWGALNTDGQASRELRYGDMLMVDKATCRHPDGNIDDYEMCINSGSSGVGKGDSGGAVFTPRGMIQIGISSYALKAGTTQPFIAIDVRKFYQWIIDNTIGERPQFQAQSYF